LAEAAALLVLRKKADAIWGTDEWLNPRQEAETKKETKVS
jgi:transposase